VRSLRKSRPTSVTAAAAQRVNVEVPHYVAKVFIASLTDFPQLKCGLSEYSPGETLRSYQQFHPNETICLLQISSVSGISTRQSHAPHPSLLSGLSIPPSKSINGHEVVCAVRVASNRKSPDSFASSPVMGSSYTDGRSIPTNSTLSTPKAAPSVLQSRSSSALQFWSASHQSLRHTPTSSTVSLNNLSCIGLSFGGYKGLGIHAVSYRLHTNQRTGRALLP